MNREILTLAANDLACYAVATHPNFEMAGHTEAIVDRLEAVERGEIKRLMIFLPPRHGKSMLTSEIFPSWYLGRHPDRYVVGASYSTDLATDFGRKVRNTVADPIHGAIFPKSRLSEDSGGQQKFSTTANGAYYAVGRGSGLTGRGAHLLLLDDLLKDRGAPVQVLNVIDERAMSIRVPRLHSISESPSVVLCACSLLIEQYARAILFISLISVTGD